MFELVFVTLRKLLVHDLKERPRSSPGKDQVKFYKTWTVQVGPTRIEFLHLRIFIRNFTKNWSYETGILVIFWVKMDDLRDEMHEKCDSKWIIFLCDRLIIFIQQSKFSTSSKSSNRSSSNNQQETIVS